jgi:hypothetical protein
MVNLEHPDCSVTVCSLKNSDEQCNHFAEYAAKSQALNVAATQIE